MAKDEESEELEKLRKDYPNIIVTKDENRTRLKCTLTGHEMPPTVAAVKQYIIGKKYRNYLANPTFDFSQYQPHIQPVITPQNKGKNQLYCQLTFRLINRDPVHVLRHVGGKRYQREKHRFDGCKKQGIPYVPIQRTKQKNVQAEHEGPDGEFEKHEVDDKKFSLNPEISDSEVEEKEKDDLKDLYPPEDFLVKDADLKVEKQKEEAKSDSSVDAESRSEDELSTDEENDQIKPKFKGIPFKIPPAKRKNKTFSNGLAKKSRK